MAWAEKYANFDLTTGLNDGSSEANAWKTPSDVGTNVAAGDKVWIKTPTREDHGGTNITWSTNGTATNGIWYIGYTSVPGDGGMWQMGSSTGSAATFSISGAWVTCENLDYAPISGANQVGFVLGGGGSTLINSRIDSKIDIHCSNSKGCYFTLSRAAALNITLNDTNSTETLHENSIIDAGLSTASWTSNMDMYDVHATFRNCIWIGRGETGQGAVRFGRPANSRGFILTGCRFYNYDGDGITLDNELNTGKRSSHIHNCVFSEIGGYAVTREDVTALGYIRMDGNYVHNVTSGLTDYPDEIVTNTKTLTSSPFTDAANDDLSLSNSGGGGQVVRDDGYVPIQMPVDFSGGGWALEQTYEYSESTTWIETGKKYYPSRTFGAEGGVNTWSISASTTKIAVVFQAPKTGTIERVLYSILDFSGNTGTPDLRIALQNVDADMEPDNTDDEYRVIDYTDISSADQEMLWSGIVSSDGTDTGTKRSVTGGDYFAVVFSIDTFVAGEVIRCPIKNNSQGGRWEDPVGLSSTDTGATYSYGSAGACVGVEMTDGTMIYGSSSFERKSSIVAMNTGTTPDEAGVMYTPEVTERLTGVVSTFQMQDDAYHWDLICYDEAGTVLGTINITDGLQLLGHSSTHYFDTPIELTANNTYYIVWKAQHASSNYMKQWLGYMPDAASWKVAGIDTERFKRASRTDAGAWTTADTEYYRMSLVIDAIKPLVPVARILGAMNGGFN